MHLWITSPSATSSGGAFHEATSALLKWTWLTGQVLYCNQPRVVLGVGRVYTVSYHLRGISLLLPLRGWCPSPCWCIPYMQWVAVHVCMHNRRACIMNICIQLPLTAPRWICWSCSRTSVNVLIAIWKAPSVQVAVAAVTTGMGKGEEGVQWANATCTRAQPLRLFMLLHKSHLVASSHAEA